MPFPGSILLSTKQKRLPDDYDDTALIQLARGLNPMDKPVRDKMLKYAMRPDRKAVEHFPSEYRLKKVYETWYAKKLQQVLDIVVMSNVMLFVMEKQYPLETPDRHTIECLKTSIDEGWYFKDPEVYALNYNRTPIIMYCLARLIAKDSRGEFTKQRKVLIGHLRQALEQTDQNIEKAIIATSLLRLGERVNLTLSREQVMRDAQSFAFYSVSLSRMVSPMYWRSEAVSWALIYELLSFNPTIHWKE